MEEKVKAYIAGIIDGEGCLSIVGNLKRLRPIVEISNCNKDLINWLLKNFKDFTVYNSKYIDSRNIKYKPQFRIVLNTYDSIFRLLNEIKPYLVIKSKQADIIIKFIESRFKRLEKGYHSHISKEEIKFRNKIQKLNKKGGKTS